MAMTEGFLEVETTISDQFQPVSLKYTEALSVFHTNEANFIKVISWTTTAVYMLVSSFTYPIIPHFLRLIPEELLEMNGVITL